ncbi:hypothetical protein ROLI_033280 [Roseobacter fucihabitans]|uniref:Uncharacterized protein n=1 Tax=Roseobacter fucihabitans TaxID=1537242 RepID=A0ABZ2BY37_9RHOB|nr:hypothetical protein [Roseobacter litoralis]
MSDQYVPALRQRFLPFRDIAAQYLAGQWKTCKSKGCSPRRRRCICAGCEILHGFWGVLQILRRRRIYGRFSWI